ncbi:MAG: type II secretion system protein [Opitutales bacterium]|nr:type II secretion system protein [Opitutales bacterium]
MNGSVKLESRNGFTLMEIIATLLILSVVAVLLLPIWISGLRATVEGSNRLLSIYGLRSEAVQIMADFSNQLDSTVPDQIASRYDSKPNYTLSFEWIEYNEFGFAQYNAIPESTPPNHLRVTLEDVNTGLHYNFYISGSTEE